MTLHTFRFFKNFAIHVVLALKLYNELIRLAEEELKVILSGSIGPITDPRGLPMVLRPPSASSAVRYNAAW